MTENFLVSGGSGAIGAALCRRLASAGYRPVVGYGANRRDAEAVAEETGGTALALDMTDDETISATIAALSDGPGRLAGVALAASPPPMIAPFGKISPDDWALQWRVNVAGPRALMAGLVRHCFRPVRKGVAVAVLSTAMGVDGDAARHMASYVVAKFGLLGLMKVLASEYPFLSVHTVSPDFTETPMLDAFDERYLDQLRATRPNNRFCAPDEVALEIMILIGAEK